MPFNSSNWDPRGSLWHRWDPHIHAPGTVRNDQFGGDWTAYLTAINESFPKIRALGITDYCTIDSYRRVLAEKTAGRLPQVELLFPNVEMRFDVKTEKGSGINFHLLFSPEDVNHLEEIDRILGQLLFEYNERAYHCTRAELIALGKAFEPKHTQEAAAFAEGANQFKVSFTHLRELFRREVWLRENCLVALAGGQDGMAGLQASDAFTATREEIQRFAHLIFSGQPSDRKFWIGHNEKMDRNAIESKYRTLKPCLHGCDAHELSKVGVPDQERYCWIKGDLAFESLRQALIEPEERVAVGAQPPLSPADSVTIDSVTPVGTPWLTNKVIPFSPGLIAIIGARGSGKTALVDLIAAGADALLHPLAESSFLRRATNPVDLIGDAKVEERWRDGETVIRAFSPPEPFLDAPLPSVSYLSQQFVERLCSSAGLASELRAEIERVIFDQTDPIDRFEADSFTELASELLEPVRHRRKQQIETVIDYSNKASEEQRLHDQLPKLRADHAALAAALVKQRDELTKLIPKGKEQRVKRLLELEAACTKCEGGVDRLRRRTRTLDDLQADADHVRDHSEPSRFASMKERFSEAELTSTEWEAFRQVFSGDVAAIIVRAKEAATKETKRLVSGEDGGRINSSDTQLEHWPLLALREERDKVKKEVGVDAERQTKYNVLKRSVDTSESGLKKLDATIKNAEGADGRRRDLVQARRNAYRAVFDTFEEEQKVLEQLYAPLHAQIQDAKGALGKLRFVVKRQVQFDKWIQAGEGLLDLRMDSQFRGHGTLAQHAGKSLLATWYKGTAEDVATAMQNFVRQFATDLQNAMPSSVGPEARTDWLKQVGNWLYDSAHISIVYGLEYDGVAVEQLSPGTRGIVLLLVYLAIDLSDRRPLLIDQPEENLDPQSVQDDLVPHFREARKRRQVIIVTHNPNLVVNTDADQVIVASATPTPGERLPKISYQSGSLENPKIRHSVCDILEGGERAFLERERRYRLQWEQLLEDQNPQTGGQ